MRVKQRKNTITWKYGLLQEVQPCGYAVSELPQWYCCGPVFQSHWVCILQHETIHWTWSIHNYRPRSTEIIWLVASVSPSVCSSGFLEANLCITFLVQSYIVHNVALCWLGGAHDVFFMYIISYQLDGAQYEVVSLDVRPSGYTPKKDYRTSISCCFQNFCS